MQLSVKSIMASMNWAHGTAGQLRADNPSPQFWQAWHDHKIWMKNMGFSVCKTRAGWCVFVQDSSLINLLSKSELREAG